MLAKPTSKYLLFSILLTWLIQFDCTAQEPSGPPAEDGQVRFALFPKSTPPPEISPNEPDVAEYPIPLLSPPDTESPLGLFDESKPLWQRATNIPISVGAIWMSGSQSGLTNYNTSFKFPILRLFGTPPPIVKTGFSFTELLPAPDLDLPRELFEYTTSVSKVFRVGERWTIRTMIGVGFATDNRNTSGDAWQFRGGGFGIYKWSETWQFTVGAIALGRSDLPVVPALGAVWTPSESLRMDLIPPNPKINFLLGEVNNYQNWVYLGGGFNGTTWGYRTIDNRNDQLTYGDLRLTLGWNSTPKAPPGVPFARGRKYTAELGYIFSRDLEFENETRDISLDDAWMIRMETRY